MAEPYVPQGDVYVTLVNGTNNNVGGCYTASRIRFTGLTGVATVTGLTLGHPGRVQWLHNDTAYVITLPHDNAGSVAANRFSTRRGVSFSLQPGQIVGTIYDGVNSRLKVLDSEDIIVDSSGNVGVGGAPSERVEILASAGAHLMLKLTAVADKFAQLGYYEAGSLKWNLYNDFSTDDFTFGNGTGAKVFISQGGNVGIGGTSFGGGAKVVFIGNAGTNPSSNPTAGHILYADTGALKGRGSSGTVTTIAAAEPHCPQCRGDVAVIESVNHEGGYFFLCLRCMVEDLNLAGKPYVIRDDHPTLKPSKRSGAELLTAITTAKAVALAAREAAKEVAVTAPVEGTEEKP